MPDFLAFVEPEIKRLPLDGGAWIDVKAELNYGEEQDMYAAMRRQFGPGEVPILDSTLIGQARMAAYIVGWSFVDPSSGKPVPVSASAMRDLRRPVAKAIRDALEKHEETIDAAQVQEKKDPATVSG